MHEECLTNAAAVVNSTTRQFEVNDLANQNDSYAGRGPPLNLWGSPHFKGVRHLMQLQSPCWRVGLTRKMPSLRPINLGQLTLPLEPSPLVM